MSLASVVSFTFAAFAGRPQISAVFSVAPVPLNFLPCRLCCCFAVASHCIAFPSHEIHLFACCSGFPSWCMLGFVALPFTAFLVNPHPNPAFLSRLACHRPPLRSCFPVGPVGILHLLVWLLLFPRSYVHIAFQYARPPNRQFSLATGVPAF